MRPLTSGPDVKGMVQVSLKSPNVPVGTADTWNVWVDQNTNGIVSRACDVVLMNGFPFWQGATPGEALEKLKQAIWDTRRAVGYEKPFVIGETGWPSRGPNFGAAVASLENAQAYWKAAACWLQASPSNYPWFWFSAWDEPNKAEGVEQAFGVGMNTQPLKFNLQC